MVHIMLFRADPSFASQVIYGKAGDVAKECEALTFLGEVVQLQYPYIYHELCFQVSLENSNFEQAVEDLTVCLAKRIKSMPADSRYI